MVSEGFLVSHGGFLECYSPWGCKETQLMNKNSIEFNSYAYPPLSPKSSKGFKDKVGKSFPETEQKDNEIY